MKYKLFKKEEYNSGFSNFWTIIIFLFLLLIVTGLIWIFWPIIQRQGLFGLIKNRSSISGTLDLNGPIPTGSQLLITQTEIGQTNVTTSQIVISPVDEQNFIIESKAGKSYEVNAQLVQSTGQTTVSNTSYVTAPAKSESIRINFTDTNKTVTQTQNTTISGNIKINGYIPSGAYIKVEGKTSTQENYVILVEGVTANQNIQIEYTQAIANQTYQIRSEMFDKDGNTIGKSNTIEVAAPAQNEELVINSLAVAPSSLATINGFITLNGNTPPNSSIVIYWKKTGETSYTKALDGIEPIDGTKWSITNAVLGVNYEMFAVLKQKTDVSDKDIAGSGSQLVSAPANNIFFKINSGFQLPGAVGAITLNCKRHDSVSNRWDATVSYQAIVGAKAYWYEVGSTSTWNDVLNQKALSIGTSYQSADINILDSVIYYTRYAFNNTGSFEDSSFSPFTGVSNLKCPP